ncbi:MAG: DNA methyltransferase [Candidatus Hadarchaeaceae archaeon]
MVESMSYRTIKTNEDLFGKRADAGRLVNTRDRYLPESDKVIKGHRTMEEITHEDYRKFLEKHDHVLIENVKVSLPKKHEILKFAPENFVPESTTVWSFPDRGDWATHLGNYRGNWSPYIPRNLILRYTKKGDLVLDQMAGSGTTLVECKLLQRRGIGVDINHDAVMVMRNRLDFKYKPLEDYEEPEIRTYVGDARNLNLIRDENIDLIATHPPYASIIPYSNQRVEGDLSSVRDITEFAEEMRKVAEESYRVLKPGKHCAILMGDTRKHKHFVPITSRLLQSFLDVGFILREDIIKMQWKMKSTREKWRGKYDFLLIAHEHLYVFRKPETGERLSQFKESMKWWNKEEERNA